ncbi:MAG: type II secretion system F family protein [Armatimonadetes bacterium]|nr:type II secretion system F family protein [Armatimonadota bacterium]
MPIFEFQATDSTGKTIRGTQFGATFEVVSQALTQQGLAIQKLEQSTGAPLDSAAVHVRVPETPVETPPSYDYGNPLQSFRAEEKAYNPTDALNMRRPWLLTELLGPIFGRVQLSQLSFYYRQMSVMMGAGINPVQALNTLSGQTQSPKLRKILRELSDHALAGRPLSAGMQRYPEVFNPLTMSLVRVGERTGMIEETYAQMADYTEREIEIRNLIRKTTFYPKLIVGASIVVLSAANLIISELAPTGRRIQAPLMEGKVWIILLPLLIALFLFFRVGLANFRIKYLWDQFIYYVPYIGNTVKQFSMAKFGRALGALYKAGVPVHESFRLASDSCGNEYMRARLAPVFHRLEQGDGMSATLRSAGVFSPIVLDMVSTGEQTGNLDRMLDKMAEFYEGEAEVRAINLGHVVGVLALLIVAGYIAYIYVTNMVNIVGGGFQDALKAANE